MATDDVEEKQLWERVFLGSMWIVYDFDPPQQRYDKFMATARPRFAHFLDGLLLYNRVVLPTQDFTVLIVLIGVLGERAVIDLLENGELGFIRLQGAFAYGGNGAGMLRYQIAHKDTMKPSLPTFVDTPESLDAVLGTLKSPVDPLLRELVLDNSVTVPAADVSDIAIKETYSDIVSSAHLSRFFPDGSSLSALPGIEPNKLRCYSYNQAAETPDDYIGTLLQLSTANVELELSRRSECVDATTLTPVGHLIQGKVERVTGKRPPLDQWYFVQHMNHQPDLASYVIDTPLDQRGDALQALLKIKRRNDGTAFRQWFHQNCRGKAEDAAKGYADLLREVPFVDRLGSRITRFLATSAVGLIPVVGPVLGTAVGALDSFLFSRLLSPASPKYFLSEVRRVTKA